MDKNWIGLDGILGICQDFSCFVFIFLVHFMVAGFWLCYDVN